MMQNKGQVRDWYTCAGKFNDIHSITCQLRWVWLVDVSGMTCRALIGIFVAEKGNKGE